MNKFSLLLALTFLAGGAPAAHAAPADGKVAINYNRCDGKYDGWGLHAWRYPSLPLDGVAWNKPLPPSGTNDFGVYWEMTLADFGSSGSVNYIIHKGDNKDQAGKDMKFDGKAIREIWVNNGDMAIYMSADEAKKAREAKPCP